MTSLHVKDFRELATFSKQQTKIEDFICSLKALGTLRPLEPAPPAPSTITKAKLSVWMAEIDALHVELDQLETGDLGRLRHLAKVASEKTDGLAPQEVDLVELVLQTLFSLDQLFHLMRSRSRNLDLLTLRIQWDDQCAAIEKEATALTLDVPKFIRKARWVIPDEAILQRSRRTSGHSPTKSPSLLGPTARNSPLGGGQTSSIMARRMRQDILLLDQARHNQRIHSLSHALVPAAGKTLDKMIDLSPVRLPDSFLDVQEKLEDETAAYTRGLASFLSGLVGQWKAADEIYWSTIENVEMKAEEVQREVSAALLREPDEEMAGFFQAQYIELDNLLRRLHKQTDAIARPHHPSSPEQPSETEALIICLNQALEKAATSLSKLSDLIKTYRSAASALNTCIKYKAACEASTETFNALSRSLASTLSTLPALNNESCVEQTDPQESFTFTKLSQISARVRAETAEAQVLNKDASAALVELWKVSGVDPNVKRSLRDGAQSLLDASNRANGLVKQSHQTRLILDLARSFQRTVEGCFEEIRIAREGLRREVSKAYWSPEKGKSRDVVDIQASLDRLRNLIDDRLLPPMMQADALELKTLHPRLFSYLELGASRIREKFEAVLQLMDQHRNACVQAEEADQVMPTLLSAQEGLARLFSRGGDIVRRDHISRDELASFEQDLSAQATIVNNMSDMHRRISMIATQSTLPHPDAILPLATASASFALKVILKPVAGSSPPAQNLSDMELQDEVVRTAINSRHLHLASQVKQCQDLMDRLRRLKTITDFDTDISAIRQLQQSLSHSLGRTSADPAISLDGNLTTLRDLATQANECLASLATAQARFDELAKAIPSSHSASNFPNERSVVIDPRLSKLDGLSIEGTKLLSDIKAQQQEIQAMMSAEERESQARMSTEKQEQENIARQEREAAATATKLEQDRADQSLALASLAEQAGQLHERIEDQAREVGFIREGIKGLSHSSEEEQLQQLEDRLAALQASIEAITFLKQQLDQDLSSEIILAAAVSHKEKHASTSASCIRVSQASQDLRAGHHEARGALSGAWQTVAAFKQQQEDIAAMKTERQRKENLLTEVCEHRDIMYGLLVPIEASISNPDLLLSGTQEWSAQYEPLAKSLDEAAKSFRQFHSKLSTYQTEISSDQAESRDMLEELLASRDEIAIRLKNHQQAFKDIPSRRQTALADQEIRRANVARELELARRKAEALAAQEAAWSQQLEEAIDEIKGVHELCVACQSTLTDLAAFYVKEEYYADLATPIELLEDKLETVRTLEGRCLDLQQALQMLRTEKPTTSAALDMSDISLRLAESIAVLSAVNNEGQAFRERISFLTSIKPPTSPSVNSDDPFSDVGLPKSSSQPSIRLQAENPNQCAAAAGSLYRLNSLREHLGELDVDQVTSLKRSVEYTSLPNIDEASKLERQLSLVASQFNSLRADGLMSDQQESMTEELQNKTRQVAQYTRLARFKMQADTCNTILSDLLEAIDNHSYTSTPNIGSDTVNPHEATQSYTVLHEALRGASLAMSDLDEASRPVQDDERVTQSLKRIDTVWQEMSSLAAEKLQDEPTESHKKTPSVDSGCSVTTRSVSDSRSMYRARVPLVEKRSISASTSMSRIPTLSTRTRTLSQKSSLRQSQSMRSFASVSEIDEFGQMKSSRPPSSRSAAANSIATPIRRRYGSIGVKPTNAALSPSSTLSSSTGSIRKSSSIRSVSQLSASVSMRRSSTARSLHEVPKTFYKASKHRTLDKEIARIVNDIPIEIPIAPHRDDYQDSSGRYVIAGKLYYCRILRSSAVMVRVGGGWTNLDDFLHNHFAHLYKDRQDAPGTIKKSSPRLSSARVSAGRRVSGPSDAAALAMLIPSNDGSPGTRWR